MLQIIPSVQTTIPLAHVFPSSFVRGKDYIYQILFSINRNDINELRSQNKLQFQLAPGEPKIENFQLEYGCFGNVLLARSAKKAHFVALKVTQGVASQKELQIQKKFKGMPYIFLAIDYVEQNNCFIQILELADLKSLEQLIPSIYILKSPCFKEQVMYCIAKDCLMGAKSMHNQSYYHLAIKPTHLLCNEKGVFSLSHFGCSEKLPNGFIHTNQAHRERAYFPPEKFGKPGMLDAAKMDVWAIGISLLHAFVGETSFRELTYSSLIQELAQLFPSSQKESFGSFIKELLIFEPQKRPTTEQALHHSWMLKMATHPEQETAARHYLLETVEALSRKDIYPLNPQDLPPAQFTNFVQRPFLEKKILKRLLNKTPQLVVCQGSSGVGKTELVTYITHNPKINAVFGYKFWFRFSNNKKLLDFQHIHLARELKLIYDDATPMETVIKLLHDHLRTQSIPPLLIFDNANDISCIQPYLPTGVHVLCTSTSTGWENPILIDSLSRKEGISLIHQLLNRQARNAESLYAQLAGLPIAICLACAYIHTQSLSITNYIQQIQKIALDEQRFDNKLPPFLTALWHLTFYTLQMKELSAMSLLNHLVHLAPDCIPDTLLRHFGDKESIKTLKDSAILKNQSIHRLTQTLFLSMQPRDLQVQSLEKTMKILHEAYTYPECFPSPEQCTYNLGLLPHGMEVVAHTETLKEASLQLSLAQTLTWMGCLYIDRNQYVEAKNHLEKALAIREIILPHNHPDVATSLNYLGTAWYTLGHYVNAFSCYEHSLKMRKDSFGENHLDVSISLTNVGTALDALGNHELAIDHYMQSLEIFNTISMETHPNAATTLTYLGNAWHALGHYSEAISFYARSLTIYENTLGENHPETATVLSCLGNAWNALGHYSETVLFHKRSLTIYENALGETHPKVATALGNLGNAQYAVGDYIEAISFYKRSLAIYENALGNRHPNVATALDNLGDAQYVVGNYSEAISSYERSLTIYENSLGQNHPNIATALGCLGNALYAAGNYSKAIFCYKRSLKIYTNSFGKSHLNIPLILDCLGNAWNAVGNQNTALSLYAEAAEIREQLYGREEPHLE